MSSSAINTVSYFPWSDRPSLHSFARKLYARYPSVERHSLLRLQIMVVFHGKSCIGMQPEHLVCHQNISMKLIIFNTPSRFFFHQDVLKHETGTKQNQTLGLHGGMNVVPHSKVPLPWFLPSHQWPYQHCFPTFRADVNPGKRTNNDLAVSGK